MDPELTPAMTEIGILFCSSTRRTPTCAIPRANPPPSPRPIRGSVDFRESPLRIQFLGLFHQVPAGFVSPSIPLTPPEVPGSRIMFNIRDPLAISMHFRYQISRCASKFDCNICYTVL